MPRARVRAALLQRSAEVRDQWTRRALRVVPEFVCGRLAHRTRQPVTRTVLWRAPDNHARSAKVVRQQKAHGRVGIGQEGAVNRRPGLGANAWHAVVMVVPVSRNKSVDRKGDRENCLAEYALPRKREDRQRHGGARDVCPAQAASDEPGDPLCLVSGRSVDAVPRPEQIWHRRQPSRVKIINKRWPEVAVSLQMLGYRAPEFCQIGSSCWAYRSYSGLAPSPSGMP
eukprot:COSAG04_NODE_1345_length_7143_cov_1.712663_2_plen_227_part_00